MYISTDAIILKNINFKESSIISKFFTYNQGKVSIIIKGARKSKANIAGIIEPGNIINCTFYNGKSSLKTFKDANLKKAHCHTRKHLLNYYFSMAVISILDKSIEENYKLGDIYNLSVHVLDMINTKDVNLDLIFTYFLIHMMSNLGFNIHNNYNDNDKDAIDLLMKLNTANDASIIDNIDHQLVDRIKIIVYDSMKNHLMDLSDIHAVNMIKKIKHETSP